MKPSFFFCTATLVLAAANNGRSQGPAPMPNPVATTGYVETFKASPADSLEVRQARTAARLGRRLVNGETQLLHSFAALYQEVWQNADGLTPQQVCDALGTKAANLFVVAGTMSNALYTIDPAGLGTMVSVPPGYAATLHADGTVTLVFTAPAASPLPSPTATP